MAGDLKALLHAEMAALKRAEGQWDRIRALRLLFADRELAEMLGLNEEIIAVAFARVHRDQKRSEEKHFEAADRLTEVASAQES